MPGVPKREATPPEKAPDGEFTGAQRAKFLSLLEDTGRTVLETVQDMDLDPDQFKEDYLDRVATDAGLWVCCECGTWVDYEELYDEEADETPCLCCRNEDSDELEGS